MSVPAFGSVTPNARLSRPAAISGRMRRRRSSLPCLMMGMRREDGEVDRGRAREARAGGADRLEHEDGLGHAQPGAPVGLGDRQPEPARLGERLHELGRVLGLPVLLPPVLPAELRASAATCRRISAWASVRAKSIGVPQAVCRRLGRRATPEAAPRGGPARSPSARASSSRLPPPAAPGRGRRGSGAGASGRRERAHLRLRRSDGLNAEVSHPGSPVTCSISSTAPCCRGSAPRPGGRCP